jgi:hypothetical protein
MRFASGSVTSSHRAMSDNVSLDSSLAFTCDQLFTLVSQLSISSWGKSLASASCN